MFLGHYGLAFAAKRLAPRTSLGTLVLAAQLSAARKKAQLDRRLPDQLTEGLDSEDGTTAWRRVGRRPGKR